MKKILRLFWKSLAVLLLVVLLAFVATGVSPVYDFPEPRPFSGPDIFNPYAEIAGLDSVGWKRANFHTHTRVEGIMNECKYWPDYVDSVYRRLGYDIVTFSNHNELTTHPYDPALQVNVYEHGINIYKYHKLVFGCREVNHFDHLLPFFVFQKQFILDLLAKDADFLQMNHPFGTYGTCEEHFRQLEGYRIMELDHYESVEVEYWDWALSAGHYSFGLANDDLHKPDITNRIAIRCNFLHCASPRYEDIRRTLLTGDYYAMGVPDHGGGDWEAKYECNRRLPFVRGIGLDSATVFINLSHKADSIKFIGQDRRLLLLQRDDSTARYTMRPEDTYVRIAAFFPSGEVIYTNPFARYDASKASSPYREPAHTINIPLTILYNLLLLLLCAAIVWAIRRVVKG